MLLAFNIHACKYWPIEPPLQSINAVMLYGRDDFAAELTNLSSLAKTILNELHVAEKFADRRFFVTYEGLNPSTITFETFTTRFAGALGIEIAGADPVFEETSASSAIGDIPPVTSMKWPISWYHSGSRVTQSYEKTLDWSVKHTVHIGKSKVTRPEDTVDLLLPFQ
ncbi:hypothetical protein BDR04DRAFT_1231862 [Suillus decipiens]|nr:hypothetical protein BDR04DRAFT_1231862 [Suillus decipiens]